MAAFNTLFVWAAEATFESSAMKRCKWFFMYGCECNRLFPTAADF
jgi:hypothetical protein